LSTPEVLNNALDYPFAEWNNKTVGFASYGGVGGARAAEHVRQICGALQMADVPQEVAVALVSAFQNASAFKPSDYNVAALKAKNPRLSVSTRVLRRAQSINRTTMIGNLPCLQRHHKLALSDVTALVKTRVEACRAKDIDRLMSLCARLRLFRRCPSASVRWISGNPGQLSALVR
jgi:hypothetical protein